MAENQTTRRNKPRLLSAIALERLVSDQRPDKAHYDDPTDGQSSTLSKALGALSQAVETSLAMGNGPAWLILGLGAGLIGYFALPYEPALWALYPLAALLAAMVWHSRFGVGLYGATIALFLVLGMLLGAQTARFADAPQILQETVTQVTGRVTRVEQRAPSRARLTLDRLSIEDMEADETPQRIRITVIADQGTIAPGYEIDVLARLGPPPEPVMPGARNLRRELYFDSIGATGFSYGRPSRIETPTQADTLSHLWHSVERVRLTLAQRFSQTLRGDTGALAATLLVGKRDGLSEESYEALRRAGLAHLLAISGMHMAMMTLSAIAVFNLLLALHPSASAASGTLRWCAAAGLIIASGYLLLSGASTATQRAFVMIVIVLVAMMMSRRALTIRGVAFAAFIVLLIHPESILGPSFQMSFAATLALVAFYGACASSQRVWQVRNALQASRWASVLKPLGLISGIALTSLVAGLATAPFAAYHFSVGAPLGLLGNVLALPLVSLIIMPAGLVALFLTPFALEAPALMVMGFGIDLVMVVARWVESLEGSRVAIAAITPQALLLLTLAGCLAALFVGRARLFALGALAAIPVWGVFQPFPELIIERDAATVAYMARDENGTGFLDRSITRGSAFSVDVWGQRLALDSESIQPARGWTCDPLGCALRLPEGETVAHVIDLAALEEDCRLADIVITSLAVHSQCDSSLVVDGQTLRDHGAVALVRDAHGTLTPWVTFSRRTRPWEQVTN